MKADGSTIANLALGWPDDSWRLQVDVLNLFDSGDHGIDYFYASRLPGEPAEGMEDRHYHVFEPRQVRVQLTRKFYVGHPSCAIVDLSHEFTNCSAC
ncbi:MAG: hypothetical protein AB8B48_04400 [Pseudomonadales bacterium]